MMSRRKFCGAPSPMKELTRKIFVWGVCVCVCLGVEGERYEIIIFSGLTGVYISNVFIYI